MSEPPPPVQFDTHPDRYRHWRLQVDGETATLTWDVQEDQPLRPGYTLKLNSYDLGVDIELADAIQRLRFQHPKVKAVVIRSGKDRVFSAGANIRMLGSSSHGFKVNFCKFTNETRLAIEDASAGSGQKYLAACNGVTAGGGYELALACDRILLVDDGASTVSLPEVPLLGMVSRLTYQKGLDLVEEVMPNLLKHRRFSLAVLGSGASRYEEFFSWLQGSFPDRVCFYRGFNNRLAHWIEAGSDMFLMPSVYEPCGLNQMYSQRYGSVPIVRATGGLADSVKLFNPATGEGTGIVFNDFDRPGLTWAITTALDLFADKKAWRRLVKNGMSEDFSWDRQGQHYVDLYRLMSPANGHPDGSGPGTS